MKFIFELESDINDVLSEFGMPEFTLLPEIADVNDMVGRVVRGYHKEVKIQSIWGGIRNPAGVLQNKIRHELTNYDIVRDAVSNALYDGMDEVFVMDIREELVDMSYQMCDEIIRILPKVIQVLDTKGAIQITRKQLFKANDGYWNREAKQLKYDKKRIAA